MHFRMIEVSMHSFQTSLPARRNTREFISQVVKETELNYYQHGRHVCTPPLPRLHLQKGAQTGHLPGFHHLPLSKLSPP